MNASPRASRVPVDWFTLLGAAVGVAALLLALTRGLSPALPLTVLAVTAAHARIR